MPARIGLLVKFDPPAPLTCIGRFVRAADQFKIPSRNDTRSLHKFYLAPAVCVKFGSRLLGCRRSYDQ
nr:hypothetical protein [uncultured Campylobacter sp.]